MKKLQKNEKNWIDNWIIYTCCCSKQKDILLSYDLKPAKKFIDLMNYLEKKDKNGFNNHQISKELKIQNLLNNNKDKELEKKINSLLVLPIYQEFAKITFAKIDTNKYQGKEAYQKAFLALPYECISISGGISEQWVEYWTKDYDSKALLFLADIEKQKQDINRKVFDLCFPLLPENFDQNQKVEVLFCFDGNRGSFTTENNIVMDMLGFSEFDVSFFTNVFAHELHHIIYEKYLIDYLFIDEKNPNQQALFLFQKRILMEGIAQQINSVDYSYQVKSLYNDDLKVNFWY